MMIKLSQNIIRWIIAVPCVLLTVCLVLYRAYRHSELEKDRLTLSLEEFQDKERQSVLIQRVSQQMEEIAYQQKDISEKRRQEAVAQTRKANQMQQQAEMLVKRHLLHNGRLRKPIGWRMNRRIWQWNDNYRLNNRREWPIRWLFWPWDVHWVRFLSPNTGPATWNWPRCWHILPGSSQNTMMVMCIIRLSSTLCPYLAGKINFGLDTRGLSPASGCCTKQLETRRLAGILCRDWSLSVSTVK